MSGASSPVMIPGDDDRQRVATTRSAGQRLERSGPRVVVIGRVRGNAAPRARAPPRRGRIICGTSCTVPARCAPGSVECARITSAARQAAEDAARIHGRPRAPWTTQQDCRHTDSTSRSPIG
jgi:hypothetical protein